MTINVASVTHCHRNFRLAFWNANGIRRDKYLIENFLQEEDIDILLVNETHLHPNDRLTVRGYEVYRSDKGSYGGTAIIIKCGIYHRSVDTPLFSYMEGTFVELSFSTETIIFGSMYCSPSKPLTKSDLDMLMTVGPKFVMAGDFNAKNIAWCSRLTTNRGKIIESHSTENHYHVIAPAEPTYYSYNSLVQPDVLDIALHKCNAVPMEIRTTDDFTSDHRPVIISLNLAINSRPDINMSYYITNWAIFREFLNSSLQGNPTISTQEELDAEAEIFANTLTAAMKTASQKISQATAAPLPPEIKQLIIEKKRARKKWQQSRNMEYKQRYNHLKNQVHRAVLNNMLDKLDKDIEDANNSNNIWKITRRLTKPRKKSRAQPIQGEKGPVYSDQDKAEVLAASFQEQFFPAEEKLELKWHYSEVRKTVQDFFRKSVQEKIQFTSPSEIKRICKKLSCRKAPGKDFITNLAIKNLPRKAVTCMVKIFNSSLHLQHYPSIWKHATIITIPKLHKNPQIPKNRRPISLLSTVGKVLERIILNRIRDLNVNLFPDHQMAFRAGCSTTHQVLRLVEAITKGFNNKAFTPAVFLDVAKAYDSVWHTGLIYKLIQCSVPDAIVKLIASYLSNRVFQVKEGIALSSLHSVHAGIPQGSVIGPLLYNIYAADVPTKAETHIGQYADDTLVYTTHQNPIYAVRSLQQHIDAVEEWCHKWLISLNPDKTQAVCFTMCSMKRVPNLTMANAQLKFQPHVKYLGITLDRKLLWHRHIQQTKGKSIGRIIQLFPLLKSGAITLKKKLHLYKALVLPILTYASPAWAYARPSTLKPLQVAQNKCLRIIHGGDWYTTTLQIHSDLEMPFLTSIMKLQVDRFYSKLQLSPNNLVKTLGNYNESDFTSYRTPKLAISELK